MTSFSIILTIIFIILQISGIINWAWYLIMSPIFICLILDLLIGLVAIKIFLNKRKKLKEGIKNLNKID